MFTITFQDRQGFARTAGPYGVRMAVQEMGWRAVGGPWTARIRADSSDLQRLWSLADLLRCGVQVHDPQGPAWWGYLSAVEIHAGARVVRIGLDEMATRVGVRYRPPGPSGSRGPDLYTPWVTDYASARVYGIKERMFFLDGASEAHALAYAAAMLKKVGRPLVSPGVNRRALLDSGACFALLECRGWWDTLNWRFYKEPRGLIENTRPGAEQKLGDGTISRLGATFPAQTEGAWKLAEVWVRMRKTGAPTDGMKLELCLNDSGIPGTLLGSVSVSHTAISDEWDWVRFAFSPTVTLSTSQIHWLVLSRSGAANAANHYLFSADQGQGLPGSDLYLHTSAWALRDPPADLTFHLFGSEESSEQMRRMLGSQAGGQFLSAARVETASAIHTRLYRDGSRRAREEVEELLKLGTAAGMRLLAAVTPERVARVYPQPGEESAALQIGADGRIRRDDGQLLPSSSPAAGHWARLGNLAAAGTLAGFNGRVFIESAVWDGEGMRVA
jgi:hypothetical protein